MQSAKVSAKPVYHDIVAQVSLSITITPQVVIDYQPDSYKWAGRDGTGSAKAFLRESSEAHSFHSTSR